jgi:O-antigen/teichoic acid export membrane protein
MKIKSENTKNALMVISSNLLTIIIALFTGFIIPIKISVADYAYYHVYCLYIAYAGFFHLGLVNGIYLKYGHLDETQLPVNRFRRYGKIMFVLQMAAVTILAVLLFVFQPADSNNTLAYAFIILNIPLINMKWFYSSMNQFTKRFVIDSIVTYLQNALTLVMVLLIIVFRWYHFEFLLILTTVINFICMLMVMYQNRRFIGKSEEVQEESDLRPLIRSGFFLMLSEFVGIIILGIDSMFVQNLYSVNEFAMYSFAISIITVIYTLISTVSNLIYPYLVRVNEEKYAEYYTLMSDVLSVIAIFSLLAFYAAKFIIVTWMDKYEASISITAILFGTVIFRSLIMLVCGNFFKVLKMIKEYTRNNVFAIIISFILPLVAYFIFKEYHYIAIASLVSFIIWYIVTDFVFIKRLNIPKSGCIRRYVCISLSLTVFYLLLQTSSLAAFGLYMLSAFMICLICFFKQFKTLAVMVQGQLATRKERS